MKTMIILATLFQLLIHQVMNNAEVTMVLWYYYYQESSASSCLKPTNISLSILINSNQSSSIFQCENESTLSPSYCKYGMILKSRIGDKIQMKIHDDNYRCPDNGCKIAFMIHVENELFYQKGIDWEWDDQLTFGDYEKFEQLYSMRPFILKPSNNSKLSYIVTFTIPSKIYLLKFHPSLINQSNNVELECDYNKFSNTKFTSYVFPKKNSTLDIGIVNPQSQEIEIKFLQEIQPPFNIWINEIITDKFDFTKTYPLKKIWFFVSEMPPDRSLEIQYTLIHNSFIHHEITSSFNIVVCHRFCKSCKEFPVPTDDNTQCLECADNYKPSNPLANAFEPKHCVLAIKDKIDEAAQFNKYHINAYDSEDPFFNDICAVFPLDDTIDVPRKDRVNKYLQNSKSLCDEGCDMKEMNFAISEPICLCPGPATRNGNLTFDGIKSNLLASLYDANFEVVLCYMLVFNRAKFPINIGSWVMIGLGIGLLITFIVYLCTKITPLSIYMITAQQNIVKEQPTPAPSRMIVNGNGLPRDDQSSTKVAVFQSHAFAKEDCKAKQLKESQEVIQEEVEENKVLNTDDYDDMEFDKLFKADNRHFFKTYWYYLKGSHPIINTFIIKNEKVLKTVKISSFLMSIMCDLSLSAFFYWDKYISNYNKNQGNDFVYNLPISIYSFILGGIINTGITFIAASESAISSIVKIPDAQTMLQKIQKFEKCYKVRVVIYFICQILISICFWYYIAAFCAVYRNSQVEWVIGSTTSIGMTMIMPFIYCILFAGVRRIGIRCKSKCLLKTLGFFMWFF